MSECRPEATLNGNVMSVPKKTSLLGDPDSARGGDAKILLGKAAPTASKPSKTQLETDLY